MKTSEEIEKLALKAYPKRIGDPYNPQEDLNEEDRLTWLEGYKQCQEDVLVDGIDTLFVEGYNQCQFDNSDKKYTEKDLLHAFREGVLLPNSQIGIMEDIFKQVVQSLNKQD